MTSKLPTTARTMVNSTRYQSRLHDGQLFAYTTVLSSVSFEPGRGVAVIASTSDSLPGNCRTVIDRSVFRVVSCREQRRSLQLRHLYFTSRFYWRTRTPNHLGSLTRLPPVYIASATCQPRSRQRGVLLHLSSCMGTAVLTPYLGVRNELYGESA